MPELSEIRAICSRHLNERNKDGFTIPDQDNSERNKDGFTIPDQDNSETKTIIQLSHFSIDQNPSITIQLVNFPLEFSDGVICYVWAFFSTSFVDTDLKKHDFRITKILGKKTEDEILKQLEVSWNNHK